jgi:hypothetical protein
MTSQTTCPKNKALFAATVPGTDRVVTRSSARDYTHALAIFRPAERQWEDTEWILDFEGVAPEGKEVIYYGRRDGAEDRTVAFVGRRIEDLPDRWGIMSFHGSAELAAKSASQWNAPRFQVVPVEIVADRRSGKEA